MHATTLKIFIPKNLNMFVRVLSVTEMANEKYKRVKTPI